MIERLDTGRGGEAFALATLLRLFTPVFGGAYRTIFLATYALLWGCAWACLSIIDIPGLFFVATMFSVFAPLVLVLCLWLPSFVSVGQILITAESLKDNTAKKEILASNIRDARATLVGLLIIVVCISAAYLLRGLMPFGNWLPTWILVHTFILALCIAILVVGLALDERRLKTLNRAHV